MPGLLILNANQKPDRLEILLTKTKQRIDCSEKTLQVKVRMLDTEGKTFKMGSSWRLHDI